MTEHTHLNEKVPSSQHEQITIETSRTILRGARDTDAPDLHLCFRDAEVMRYWSEPPHVSLEATQKWVQSMISGPNNGVTDFVICLKPTTDNETPVIGKVGVWQGNEIGFLLGREYWKRGLALEVVSKVLDLIFGIGGKVGREVPKDVVADVDPRNEASLAVLGKLGFEVYAMAERTLQVGDEWVDSVYLFLRRDVWLERREGVLRLLVSRR